MEVNLLAPIGYCKGVVNAFKVALKARQEHPEKNVYVLGMLVHNENALKVLKENNIITLANNNKTNEELINELEKGSVIIFTAHGHDERLTNLAIDKGLIVYDATCSVVKSNMEIVKNKLKENYQILFIGKENHPETMAMLALSPKIILFDVKNIENYQISTNLPIFATNQTTLNYEDLVLTYKKIQEKWPNSEIQNEICATTRLRQKALKEIDSTTDLIIVVGDKKSNNTMKLFEIAKASNVPSIMVDSLEDVKNIELSNIKKIAISSGASTPKEIVDEIKNYLLSVK